MRLINLFVAVLFLCALVPAHNVSAAPSQAVLAAPVLTAPANGLLAVDVGLRPTLKWNAVAGADSYEIQIATTSSYSNIIYPAAPALTRNVGNVLQFALDQDMPANSRLYWRVRAMDAIPPADPQAGRWSSSRYFYTRPLPVTDGFYNGPMANDGLTTAALRPTIEWDKSENVTKYILQVATNPAFTTPKVNKTIVYPATLNPLSYLLTADLPADTLHYWRVMSYGTYAKSDWSTVQTFTTPVNPPQVPVPTAPLNKILTTYSPQLTWNPVIPVPGRTITYEVQLSLSSTFATVYFDESSVSDAFFTIPDELPAATYYWRVLARDDRGVVSNWSKIYNFKTPATVVIHVMDASLFSVGTSMGIDGITVKMAGVTGTMTTADGGFVTIKSAPTGSRRIDLSGTDYLNFYKTQSIAAGRLYQFDYQIKRRPIRIDLTWGQLPSDLDVHLWTPIGTPEIHIYPDRRGSISASPWARVEKDSFGTATPKTERITIQDRFPGTYLFAVFNYGRNGTWELSGTEKDGLGVNKGAKVVMYKVDATGKIWQAYAPIYVVKPGGNYDGKWWSVFELDGNTGEISLIINQVMIESPGSYDKLGGTALEPK